MVSRQGNGRILLSGLSEFSLFGVLLKLLRVGYCFRDGLDSVYMLANISCAWGKHDDWDGYSLVRWCPVRLIGSFGWISPTVHAFLEFADHRQYQIRRQLDRKIFFIHVDLVSPQPSYCVLRLLRCTYISTVTSKHIKISSPLLCLRGIGLKQ